VKVQVKAQRERRCGRVPWRVCYNPVLAKSSVWGSEGMRRYVQQGAQSSGRPIIVESCGSWREDRDARNVAFVREEFGSWVAWALRRHGYKARM
jgi:hypothetical protein